MQQAGANSRAEEESRTGGGGQGMGFTDRRAPRCSRYTCGESTGESRTATCREEEEEEVEMHFGRWKREGVRTNKGSSPPPLSCPAQAAAEGGGGGGMQRVIDTATRSKLISVSLDG